MTDDFQNLSLEETNRQIKALRKQQYALESTNDLMRFIKYTSPDFEDPSDPDRSRYFNQRHHDAIAAAVEKVEAGDYQFLILTTAPRHGKSEIVSRRLPAWFLGRHPDQNVVVATYNDDFAKDFGSDVRSIIQSSRYKDVFPHTKLMRGGGAKERLQTTQGGMATFVGLGGSLTGRGAHLLIIDDLIKSYEEARSQAFRDRAWDWFTKVAMTRRMGRKSVVITFCLTGDTPVTMADGSWKRLDCVQQGDEVLAWDNGKQVRRKVLRTANQGPDTVFEVRTRSSRVRGNARHPFLVMRGGCPEWVKLGDLQVGDEVVTSGKRQAVARQSLSEDEAWALGFFLGDGWVTVNHKRNRKPSGKLSPTKSFVSCIADCPAYPDRVRRAINICGRKFGARFKKTKFGYWRTEKAALGRWLLQYGMGAGAKGKRVPTAVYSQPAVVRRAFLDGFAAADGCVIDRTGDQQHHNGNGGYVVTQILLANEALVLDIRHLARGLGLRVTNASQGRSRHRPPHSDAEREWVNYQFRYHHRVSKSGGFSVEKIRSITPAGEEDVYDLTIDKSENFIADGVVVHNTRWHPDDIIGRLIDPENEYYNRKLAEKIKIIELPAIADSDDHLGRAPGEALWPEWYDIDYLEEQRQLDPMGFEALYQQRPSVADGTLFRRESVQYFDPDTIDEDELRIYCASDHAVTTAQRSDSTVLLRVGLDRRNNIYILDCWWKKARTDEVVEAMLMMANRKPAPLVWWAEKGHISKSIGPFLKKRMLESNNFFTVREVTPAGDKEQRAQSIAARMQMGHVFFPRARPWTEKAINELLAFPNGLHDDFVDAFSYIGLGLRGMFPVQQTKTTNQTPRFGSFAWVKQAQKAQDRKNRIFTGSF